MSSGILFDWWHYKRNSGVLSAQGKLAMDPDSDPFRETDNSILFPTFAQADFLFVPTRYADAFEKAATLHAKYDVFLEVAVNKIVDMVIQETNATTRNFALCTTWVRRERGREKMMRECKERNQIYGLIHPFKIFTQGFRIWASTYDLMQFE